MVNVLISHLILEPPGGEDSAGLNPSSAEATFVQSTRMQTFWKPSKPSHVGIQWIALTEYPQMSTHLPEFQSFFRLAKLATSSIRVKEVLKKTTCLHASNFKLFMIVIQK